MSCELSAVSVQLSAMARASRRSLGEVTARYGLKITIYPISLRNTHNSSENFMVFLSRSRSQT